MYVKSQLVVHASLDQFSISLFAFLIFSVYPWRLQASKAALISFYGTLRLEIGSHIGITIVMPGLIDTEMTSPSSLAKVNTPIN